MPGVVTGAELDTLVAVSTAIADIERPHCEEGAVRLHIPTRLPGPEASLCSAILRRVLRLVDDEFEPLASSLFGDAPDGLCGLHASGQLSFASGGYEPAINVYYENGGFLPHEDNCALTVLIPLTSSEDGAFEGGGTGFWAPEERRVPDEDGDVGPSLVLAPPAGTALLFSGHVTHAGMPVVSGVRHCLVASFSRKWELLGCTQRPECYPEATF